MTSGQVEEPDLPGDAVRVDDLLVVLPAVPPSLHSARAALRSWLESAGSPHDGADDMVLAVNEAMANVVDHAYPTAQPGQVHLHAWVSTNAATRTRRVIVAVTDRGNWAHEHRSTAPAGYRGHGISVMSGCTAEVHIQRSAGGTTVVLVGHDLATHPEAAVDADNGPLGRLARGGPPVARLQSNASATRGASTAAPRWEE